MNTWGQVHKLKLESVNRETNGTQAEFDLSTIQT